MSLNSLLLERIHNVRSRKFLIKVETSSLPADYEKYDRLREAIWRFPEDHLSGSRNMMCENFVHDGGSLFLAAYVEAESGGFIEDENHLVGFSYGFVGIKDKALAFKSLDNLWFYAQFTGVLPGFEGYGLGLRLKEFQREILRDGWGIFEVVCTYDPLTGANAYRNIHHFGMSVRAYRVSTYGAYGGRLNRTDVPSDRFFMSWDLRRSIASPGVEAGELPVAIPQVLRVESVRVKGRTRSLDLEVVRGVDLEDSPPVCLIRIPADFYLMLQETDVENSEIRRIPLDWRLATRSVFQTLFAEGYRVTGFRRGFGQGLENDYLLKRDGS